MKKILDILGLPEDANNLIWDIYNKTCDTPEFKEIKKMIENYDNFNDIEAKCRENGEKLGINKYSFSMVAMLANIYIARDRYIEKGYDEQLFWDNVIDFKFKIDECKERQGVWGIVPVEWYQYIYETKLFKLGRLQFMVKTLANGDNIIDIHIPSGSPLDYNEVRESYKRAYNFFDKTHGDLMAFKCGSHLLYSGYQGTVFKEGSNIYKFASDFYLLRDFENPAFPACPIFFGVEYRGDTSVLPAKTSLQKAFIKHINEGGKLGSSRGAFFFDGKNIIKENIEQFKDLI